MKHYNSLANIFGTKLQDTPDYVRDYIKFHDFFVHYLGEAYDSPHTENHDWSCLMHKIGELFFTICPIKYRSCHYTTVADCLDIDFGAIRATLFVDSDNRLKVSPKFLVLMEDGKELPIDIQKAYGRLSDTELLKTYHQRFLDFWKGSGYVDPSSHLLSFIERQGYKGPHNSNK